MNHATTTRRATDVAGGSGSEIDWLPPVDIVETDAGFVIHLEFCGVPRQDIDVKLEQDRLTVSGARATAVEGETLQYRERAGGRFARSFGFRTPVDAEGIEAGLADGVLTLRIPKRRPTRIPLEQRG